MKTLSYTVGRRFALFFMVLMAAHAARCQVAVSIRVLPPYQSRITEYASRPDLMLLTLTNTSRSAQRLQLTASISGDNGIGAWVNPGYRSPQPIELAPGQALNLNGNDIAFLFDHNQIEYTGISRADFTRGVGLPEGTYQLCVQALDYDSHQPLSPEAPVGCTSFTISSVEPPTIVQPFNEQELRADGPQAFPITWSTPPGSSPFTQYRVKIVEITAARNPNDAMQSATTPPFFEETVTTNMLLYGPQYPQLTPGRQYALMVQAIDPYQTTHFRNRGMSEVTLFRYGPHEEGSAAASGETNGRVENPDVEYATNTISGKLSWAFKAAEEHFRPPLNRLYGGQAIINYLADNKTSNGTHMDVDAGTLSFHYLGHNPLQAARSTAMAQADPTLNEHLIVAAINGQGISSVTTPEASAEDIISTTGASALALGYENVAADTGAQRYPLANVVVTIKGIKPAHAGSSAPRWVGNPAQQVITVQQDIQYAGLRTAATLAKRLSMADTAPQVTVVSQQPRAISELAGGPVKSTGSTGSAGAEPLSTVLATARTDADGNFTMQLLHPAYEGKNPYDRLVVAVAAAGFEPFEYELPLQRLDDIDVDLGTLTLLAKTYRFTPSIHIEESAVATGHPGVRIKVYRDADELDRYPYLAQEGMTAAAAKTPVTIGSRKYVLVAADSAAASDRTVKSIGFSMARLFYQGSLYIEIEGLSGNLIKKTTQLRVADPHIAPARILLVKPAYESRLARPSVSGEVVLHAGENLVPVAGAVLAVTYHPEDVVAEAPNPVTTALSGMNKQVQVAALSTAMGNQAAGIVHYTANSPVNPIYSAAAATTQGVAKPVQVSAVGGETAGGGVGAFAYQPILQSDVALSDPQLREKYGPYTVKTDSAGQYRIGNLPVLKAGASYVLKVVSVPYNYRDMEIAPGNEQSFAAVRGTNETRSFSITPEVFNIVGRVIGPDEQGIPYARLHFKGGSTYFETGEGGHFQTSYYAGAHTLVIEKAGYVSQEIPVRLDAKSENKGLLERLRNVPKAINRVPPGADVMGIGNPGGWVESMQQTATVTKAVQAGQPFSPAMFGHAGAVAMPAGSGISSPQLPGGGLRSGPYSEPVEATPMAFQQLQLQTVFASQVLSTFHSNALVYAPAKTEDLGDIGPLQPRVGKVRFTVTEQGTTRALAGAQIQLFDTTHVADENGQWLYEGFGGQTTVTVTPPAGAGVVPQQVAINILETGEVTEVTLALEKGVRVHGRVTSGAQPVANARITVAGRDYLTALSGTDGTYTLQVSAGEQVLRAAKTGYFTKTENRVLSPGDDVQLDFALQGGGNRNIATLLGFNIELDQAVADGDGEKWTGRFVNLQPLEPLFGGTAAQSLPFADVRVTFDAAGNAIPQHGEVVTDVTNLPLKLFGYLPVVLGGDAPIKVVRNAEGQGTIGGPLRFAVNQIQGSRGFTFPHDNPLFFTVGTGPAEIDVFHAGSTTGPPEATVRLTSTAGSVASMDLYGFTLDLDLAASSIGTDGLHLAGTLHTPQLGPVSATQINVQALTISKDLRIQQVKVDGGDLPSLQVGGWSVSLANVLFNENGFKLGGTMKVVIPQSGESTVDFADLRLGKDAIYGGQFTFPGEGIDVYHIVRLTTGGKPLSFGRVGNLQVYSLSGSASMKFDKLITKEIRIPSFQVQTDGRFMLQAPVNYSAQLAFAKFDIKNLTVSTLSGQAPFISVQGAFNVNFKGLKFEVADIQFKARAGGGSEYSVGTIEGELTVPVMKVAVRVGLRDNGFEGGGALGIPGTPISAEVNFHYFKQSNGIDIGAQFKSGIIIPIGIVEINNIGGGFNYNSGNGKFTINIHGGASITGLSTLVNLDPISLTVSDGPVIVGEVGVKVVNAFELTKARVELNFPGKFFSIEVHSDIEPIKGVASARLNGLLRIKWDPQDPYVFLGANTTVEVLSFFKSYGEYAMGINIWDPKYRDDDIAGYFRYLDEDLYARGEDYHFSGVYLHAKTEIGVPKERAVGIDLVIVSGKAWFHSYSDAMLLLNFAGSDYRFRLAGGLSAGAEGCIGPGCIGAGFTTCYAFTGGFSDARGWFLGGKAAGSFEGHVGKKCDCNELCFIGGRICVGAHAEVSISTRGSNRFSVGLGSSDEGNSCN